MERRNAAADSLTGVDHQGVTGDISRLVAGQIKQAIGRILGRRGDAEGRSGGDALGGGVVIGRVAGDQRSGHRGDRVAGRDGVDADAVLRQFRGHRLGQADDPRALAAV